MRGAPRGPGLSPDWSERLLALAGSGDDDAACAQRWLAFTRALLLYSTARAWIAAIRLGPMEHPLWLALAGCVSAGLALGLSTLPQRRTWGLRLAAAALAVHGVATFPTTDNHFFLELACYAVLLVATPGPGLAALRWAFAIVLFHTGLQKLLWGHYWHGDFLAFMVATSAPFGDLFAWILPAGEVERLRGMRLLVDGAGPYRVDSLPLRLASNAVMLAELALPFALVHRATRTAAACAALALVAALQLGARELLFFSLFATGLCLFLPRDPLARAFPLLAGFYALLVAVSAGWLPDLGLLRGGHL